MPMSTVPGGLEIWDRRRSGKPQLRSPISWGITGSGALDAAQVRALLEHGPFCTMHLSAPRSASFLHHCSSPGRCVQKCIRVSAEAAQSPWHQIQQSAGCCMSTARSSPQECVPMHALLVMQGLGPPHAQPVASKLPTVQADAEQPFLAMHPFCMHST